LDVSFSKGFHLITNLTFVPKEYNAKGGTFSTGYCQYIEQQDPDKLEKISSLSKQIIALQNVNYSDLAGELF
jgi:hypothetical protein